MPTATLSEESVIGEGSNKAAWTSAAGAADVQQVATRAEAGEGTAIERGSGPTAGETRAATAPMSGTGVAEGAAQQRQVWRVKEEASCCRTACCGR